MSSAVADLEAGLSAMLNLKPPGVSTSRIKNLTELCQANIKDESLLVQKFYTQLKKAPGTHKLGVLYLIDSVVRKWVDLAKQQHQEVSSTAQDGTFAAGVFRVTEILPALMDNILQSAPADQKDRIKKLVDIWERAQTFPPKYIEKFRQQLKEATTTTTSTTPPGSPPAGLPGSTQRPPLAPGQQATPAAPPQAPSGTNIMDVLANIAKQSAVPGPPSASATPPIPATSTPTAAAPGLPYGAPPAQLPYQQPQQQQQPYTAPSAPTSLASTIPGFPAQLLAGLNAGQSYAPPVSSAPGGFPSVTPQVPPPPAGPAAAPAGGAPALGLNQVMLIKTLIDQGLQPNQISAILQSMSTAPQAAPQGAPAYPMATPQPQDGGWGSGAQGRDYEANDRRGYRERSRSKSPDRWGRDARGGYDRHGGANHRSASRDRGRDRPDYRQRSPMGRRDRDTPDRGHEPKKRFFEIDRSIRPGCIKVMSRTLFVGGVTCSQGEIQDIFGRVGPVQSVIINKEKRHAFVKMLTRDAAIEAKRAMGEYKSGGLALRTRWGVGFGPRDCCDYENGVSIIPISRLTEADRKWLLTAEYGGTGGAPIESGIAVEEPDIEIGAGVSSKAISRRVQTDKGGVNGPKSTKSRVDDDGAHSHHGKGGGRRDVRRDDEGGYQNPVNPNLIPPGYAFGMGGMPTYPGYSMYPPQDSNGS
ncbi:related to RNA binding protein NRD1 protein [Cephalotrichum gorgonifer]|uniref:Related to RNA binding protein NRD1 protein n=1 Tax=Cephalotrichum gorgonifer TaxID=2041049 RepID=A0AAE8N2M0_9PEZI|nr:related to RNA binding protein NRD1 protein [Cephalotrichum gorgonifer]